MRENSNFHAIFTFFPLVLIGIGIAIIVIFEYNAIAKVIGGILIMFSFALVTYVKLFLKLDPYQRGLIFTGFTTLIAFGAYFVFVTYIDTDATRMARLGVLVGTQVIVGKILLKVTEKDSPKKT